MGGTNEDEADEFAHCAVRVVDGEQGIDVTLELSPEQIGDIPWPLNQMVAASGDSDRTAAYGDAWVQVAVPQGMTSRQFDQALLQSAAVTGGQMQGTPYFFSGSLNSNRFVFETITGAGGVVPSAASARFHFAPGICGGSGLTRGSQCR